MKIRCPIGRFFRQSVLLYLPGFCGLFFAVQLLAQDQNSTHFDAPAYNPLIIPLGGPSDSSLGKPGNSATDPTEESRVTLPEVTRTISNMQVGGTAKVVSSAYPSPIPGSPQLSQSLDASVNFQLDHHPGRWENQLDTTVGKYVDWGASYFSVQQLSATYTFNDEHSQVIIGRHIFAWSEVDSNWQLGLWQPLFNIDPLRPVDQGLSGVFYQHQQGSWDVLAFASPIFVPTMGPSVQEENGSLVAESRWYQQPATSGTILGQNTKFIYALNVPDVNSLVTNPGSGFRVKWIQTPGSAHQAGQGFWVSTNYAYKPMNSLLLEYDSNLLIPNNTAQITVSPAVGYAQLFGGDIGYAFPSGKVSISYLEEDPSAQFPTNPAGTTTDWWQQEAGRLNIYGLHFDTDVSFANSLDQATLAVDYLKVMQVLTGDYDANGLYQNSILPYQTLFTNALSVKTTIRSTYRGRNLVTQLKVLRDFDQEGDIFGAEVAWQWQRRWLLSSGVDVMAPDDPSGTNQDPRFINQFRANDRIYGGVSYVF